MKKRALVICPGRGSYTKETLGYLRRYGLHVNSFLDDIDQRRRQWGEPTIRALDESETFSPPLHTRGEHASPLIYACAYADFMAIDRERFEIVAVTGNSMGWYLTCAFAGALDQAGAFQVIQTMGSMMKQTIVGGQVLYPVSDANWVSRPEHWQVVDAAVARARAREGVEIHASIYLGGYLVLGANGVGVSALMKELPPIENYPLTLINHAAFHTPLLNATSEQAFTQLRGDLFQAPHLPMIDGRGVVWTPHSTDTEALYEYTLGHQVVAPYDFTKAITVGLKEFAPDALILLGPGSSLGGSLGQILVENNWLNIDSKAAFTARQSENPFLLAMGRADQRGLVARAERAP